MSAYRNMFTGKRYRCRVIDAQTLQFWALLRWVWPLTGWWSDFRWIARIE